MKLTIDKLSKSVFEETDIPYAVFVDESGIVRRQGYLASIRNWARMQQKYCGQIRVFTNRHEHTATYVSTIHTGNCAESIIKMLTRKYTGYDDTLE